jgi:hypothetical protein
MARKGKQLLYESFEDKRMAILVGIFCLLYVGGCYLPDSLLAGKILPPWPPNLFAILAFTVLLCQAVVWKLFRHFDTKISKEAAAWLLFWGEYGLILFSVTFVSWPIYLFYLYLTQPHQPV